MPKTVHTLRVDAIVLRHSDYGEADRLLTLYTREQGKLRAIAKGVRKLQSRKAGHLEPFTRVVLMLARGHDLWIVTQAETVNAFQPLRESLNLMSEASYVVELLERFIYEEGQNVQVFDLLAATLLRLQTESSPFVPIRWYEIRLLDLLGFRPMLFECASCGKKILPEDQYFSAELGGVLCPVCGSSQPGARRVSMEALKYLRHFQRSTYERAAAADPSTAVRLEMESLMNYYLTHLLERQLKTPEFMKQIRREDESA
jgi:DNA repair protein RecO (recombination protein O)